MDSVRGCSEEGAVLGDLGGGQGRSLGDRAGTPGLRSNTGSGQGTSSGVLGRELEAPTQLRCMVRASPYFFSLGLMEELPSFLLLSNTTSQKAQKRSPCLLQTLQGRSWVTPAVSKSLSLAQSMRKVS